MRGDIYDLKRDFHKKIWSFSHNKWKKRFSLELRNYAIMALLFSPNSIMGRRHMFFYSEDTTFTTWPRQNTWSDFSFIEDHEVAIYDTRHGDVQYQFLVVCFTTIWSPFSWRIRVHSNSSPEYYFLAISLDVDPITFDSDLATSNSGESVTFSPSLIFCYLIMLSM